MPRLELLNRRAVIGLLATAPFLRAAAFAAESGDASAFISAIAQKGIVDILNANIPNADKQQRFRELFKEDFDIPAIGQFVLGRFSRTVSPEDKQQFAMLFEDVIVYTWARRFGEYNGQTLKVTNTEADGQDGSIVHSTVIGTAGGNSFNVDWRLRKRPQGWRVVDVIVGGVSMALTYRQEYTAVIGQSGFAGLVTQLKTQITDLKKQLQV